MEGYDVVTHDDEKVVGRVVGKVGDNLIVEQGTVFKSRHALPTAFAEVDETGRRVVITVPNEVLADSPKIDDEGSLDERAIAEHYGLAAASSAPRTEGYGESVPDDPAFGAEHDAERLTGTSPVQERVRARESAEPGADRLQEEPALLGERTQEREEPT